MAKSSSKKPSPAKSAGSKGSKSASGKKPVKPVVRQAAPAKAANPPVKAPTPKPVDKSTTKAKSAPVAALTAKAPAKAVQPAPKVAEKAAKAVVPALAAPVKIARADKPKRPPELHEGRNGVPVAAPVPTDGKPAKNQAGLKSSELEMYRDILLAKRREIVGDMSHMEREALQRGGGSNLSNLPIHMADMGTDNYEQEFTLGLMEKDRKLLREINDALAKIQNGSFGLCEATSKPIGKPRLEAQPWARFSIEHARKLEKRIMGH